MVKLSPIIRNNDQKNDLVPTFLSSTKYIDFRDNNKFKDNYKSLLVKVYGSLPAKLKPGKNESEDESTVKSLSDKSSISSQLSEKNHTNLNHTSLWYAGKKGVVSIITSRCDN